MSPEMNPVELRVHACVCVAHVTHGDHICVLPPPHTHGEHNCVPPHMVSTTVCPPPSRHNTPAPTSTLQLLHQCAQVGAAKGLAQGRRLTCMRGGAGRGGGEAWGRLKEGGWVAGEGAWGHLKGEDGRD